MSKDTKELLDFEIYPNLDRAEAVKDLSPQDKGKYYLLTCPKCGKPETYLYKTGIYIKCGRINRCGYAQSLWDYIQNTKGLTNRETLRELARLAGYTLPELEGYSEEKAKKARERANILEVALEYFKAQLWRTERGKEALDYLKERGYSEEELKRYGVRLLSFSERIGILHHKQSKHSKHCEHIEHLWANG